MWGWTSKDWIIYYILTFKYKNWKRVYFFLTMTVSWIETAHFLSSNRISRWIELVWKFLRSFKLALAVHTKRLFQDSTFVALKPPVLQPWSSYCQISTYKLYSRITSTDYDSLYPWHILLREQVLLQPFKILIGPVHMVLPCTRELEQKGKTTNCFWKIIVQINRLTNSMVLVSFAWI